MTAYYNEIDPYCVDWLRNLVSEGLIAPGVVDSRSIKDVNPADLRGFDQCHFFAGIGGWSYALRLAGWPDEWPVWTGSCPCQPFAAVGKRRGFADERHLWPDWLHRIQKCGPSTILGEQVARGSSAGDWVDAARFGLERMDYAFGGAVLPAVATGAIHIRERFWFVAHAGGSRLSLPECEAISGAWWREQRRATSQCDWWACEPNVGRVAYGVPNRVPQLRALGNAIVPQVAARFIKAVM